MTLDPDLKRRVMTAVAQEPSPSRPVLQRLHQLGGAVAVGLATWAGLVLSLGCEHLAPVHVIVGHVFPMLASAWLGLKLGGVLDPRRTASRLESRPGLVDQLRIY